MNTNRHFHPGGPTHLTGRKYVCGPCAEELGKSVGLVSGDDYHAALEDHRKAAEKVSELSARIHNQDELYAVVERLAPTPTVPSATSPVSKPAPPVAEKSSRKKPENRPNGTMRVTEKTLAHAKEKQ